MNAKKHKKVNPFLTRLYEMVDNTELDEIIGWSEDGQSIIIRDCERFEKSMIPLYFGH